MPCTIAADWRLGGSRSVGNDVGIGGGGADTKLGSMKNGAKRSSDRIWTSVNGPLRNLRRLSSSNIDQSIGSSANGSGKLPPFSRPFSKMSKMLVSFDKFRLLRLSFDAGKRKHSMKLAVPEFNKNFMLPRSDDEFVSCPILVDSSPIRKLHQCASTNQRSQD